MTPIDVFPDYIKQHYEIHEWRHAGAILYEDFKGECDDLISVLSGFELRKSDIVVGGGNKSAIARGLEGAFRDLDWKEREVTTKFVVNSEERQTTGHKIDCYKNGVALEVEWNSKDSVFARDLNNFRILFDLRVVSLGIIVTRCDELQDIFNELGAGKKYGESTTHMRKLLPRLDSGGGGGCPILVFGMRQSLYRPNL